MKKESVLVTGGTGFLGSHLCHQLHKQGYHVLSLSRRLNPDLEETGVKQIQMDLTAPTTQLDEVLKDVDAIFHTAGKVGVWGKWEEFYQANVIGTQNLVQAAKKAGTRYFIYTSSPSVVFDNEDIHGGGEELPYAQNSKSLYARSKIPAEKFVLSSNDENFKVLALRPHLIFGTGDQNLIPRVVEMSKKGRLRIIGDGENKVDVIHIDNAVHAHILAYKALKEKTSEVEAQAFFIAQDGPVKLWEFINKILGRYQQPRLQKHIPYFLAYGLASFIEAFYRLFRITDKEPPTTRFVVMQLAKSHYFSHAKAYEKLGYRPIIQTDEAIQTLGSS